MRCVAFIGVLLTCCVLLSACAKPQYWIKGLTLPPGATEVSKTESTVTNSQMPPLPFGLKFKKMLMVTFKDPGGWSSVSSHFDSSMAQLGYTESFGSLPGPMGASGAPGMDMMKDMMRMYSKTGSDYCVMLQNMGGMMGLAQSQAGAPPGMQDTMNAMGIGEFTMGVILVEK